MFYSKKKHSLNKSRSNYRIYKNKISHPDRRTLSNRVEMYSKRINIYQRKAKNPWILDEKKNFFLNGVGRHDIIIYYLYIHMLKYFICPKIRFIQAFITWPCIYLTVKDDYPILLYKDMNCYIVYIRLYTFYSIYIICMNFMYMYIQGLQYNCTVCTNAKQYGL